MASKLGQWCCGACGAAPPRDGSDNPPPCRCKRRAAFLCRAFGLSREEAWRRAHAMARGPALAIVFVRAFGRIHYATEAPERLHAAYARARRLRSACADPIGVRILRETAGF